MNDEKNLDRFRELIGARLRRGLGERSSRSGNNAAPAGPAASSAPDRWQDGTPRDPEQAILSQFDEERFQSGDAEYQSRPEIQTLAARLVEVRRQKAKGQPHPEIVRAGDGVPTQAEFEKNREGLNRAERRAAIERQIAEAQARLDALTDDEQ